MEKPSSLEEFWKKRIFAVVTGASRGIGRTLVEQLAKLIAPESVLLLISRDGESLNVLREAVESRHDGVHVYVGVADLSAIDEKRFDELLCSALSGRSPESFDHALCVHNAGSLSDASKRCADLIELSPCLNYFQLNLASVMVLNALFLRHTSTVKRKTVVNVSSLCGVEPFASLALYCSGKAARDMFFKVLAKEEPDVRVLNYAPGPVETSMRNQLLEQSWAEEIKAGEALTTGMTCDRLLTLLAKDDYTSGAHIDYFDP